MSSRSLGELLLRPSSLARSPLCQSCTSRQIPASWTLRRQISNTPGPSAAQPQQQPEQNKPASQSPNSSPRPQSTSTERTNQAIDNLFSRPPRRQPRNQSTSSADDLRAAQATHIFGTAFSNGSSPRRSRAPPRLAFDDMLPASGTPAPSLYNKPSEAAALAAQQEETFGNFPRLNPSYGRSVELDPSRGRDIVRGIGMLGSLMGRNRVKYDFNKQRFHERPGLKRKRLASERWRARFKKGFSHVTARVSELTRKGW